MSSNGLTCYFSEHCITPYYWRVRNIAHIHFSLVTLEGGSRHLWSLLKVSFAKWGFEVFLARGCAVL